MLTDYFFWFAQPSFTLSNYDWFAGYFFAALLALSIVVWAVKGFVAKHEVVKHLLGRYSNALFWFGVVGLVWFALRYEAVPLLSKRVFAGLIIAWGIIWLGFIKYYFVFRFFKDKEAYDYNQVKGKYISGNR
jgi:hypothetical protein